MGRTHNLVSAIVTTHNRAPYMVARAVASVLGQTYHSIEVVVVDDSDANYPMRDEVEHSVRGLSPKIAYIRHKDSQGANVARNTGLRHAHGCYIAFLDDDDEWFRNKIELQVKRIEAENAALVYCRYVAIDEPRDTEYVSRGVLLRGNVFYELLETNFFGGASGPLLRAQCVVEVGGFDELMESSQDYDLWLRIARRYHVSFVDEPLYVYHVHYGACITTNAGAKVAGAERIFKKYRTWIQGDKDILHMRLRDLTSCYLQAYGRYKAFGAWLACMWLRPVRFSSNLKSLAMIVLGYDSYMSVVTKVKAILSRRDIVALRRRESDG